MASILQMLAVVSPDKPEQPEWNRHQKKSLPKDEQITTEMLIFQFVNSLPSHHQNTCDTKKVSDRHKDPTEVVPLLNSGNSIATVTPIHDLNKHRLTPFSTPLIGQILDFLRKKKTAPGLDKPRGG